MKCILGILCIFTVSLGAQASKLINGAGATFPYPIYSKWFSEYYKNHSDVRINYQSIGSGAGIKQFIFKTVDFGATDAPMSDAELKQIGKDNVLHIPTVLGAVVVSYNLKDIKGDLKLTPDVIADIFLGKIEKWNDSRILKNNQGLNLPNTYISPVYRSDGSGTTSVFTDYLSKVSPEWIKSVGAGKAVKWPAGLGGKGNEGVAALVKQTPGSIGYVEQVYAIQNKLAMAEIKNASSKFVKPTLEAVSAAASNNLKNIPDDFRVSITNATGDNSYPIASFTYLLINKQMKPEIKNNMVAFLNWSMREGQKFAKDLSYAPLPESLIKKIEAKIKEIK